MSNHSRSFTRRYSGQAAARSGPWFDETLSFRILLAKPDMHKRALANVYDTWENLASPLQKLGQLQGLHHLENVIFNEDDHTPLLYANTEQHGKLPLAVASYPGKGRAIWLFTDQLWKLAMANDGEISRKAYNEFMQGSLTWLLRKDLRKPLYVKNFQLHYQSPGEYSWEFLLQGPATRYFDTHQGWDILVCQQLMAPQEIVEERQGENELLLKGRLSAALQGGQRCDLQLTGVHKALGSIQLGMSGVVPKTFLDREILGSTHKLQQLAKITGAQLISVNNLEKGVDSQQPINLNAWLRSTLDSDGLALPSRYRSFRDFYWIFATWYIWLLILFLPLEVIVRRYEQLIRWRY